MFVCFRMFTLCMQGPMCAMAYGDQKTICKSWCSFSSTWVPGIKFRLTSLAQALLLAGSSRRFFLCFKDQFLLRKSFRFATKLRRQYRDVPYSPAPKNSLLKWHWSRVSGPPTDNSSHEDFKCCVLNGFGKVCPVTCHPLQ